MNSFIGIKTNWYTKVKKHLHVSKQLDYITYKIRLHHIQNIQTQNQYSARLKGVKSRVLSKGGGWGQKVGDSGLIFDHCRL